MLGSMVQDPSTKRKGSHISAIERPVARCCTSRPAGCVLGALPFSALDQTRQAPDLSNLRCKEGAKLAGRVRWSPCEGSILNEGRPKCKHGAGKIMKAYLLGLRSVERLRCSAGTALLILLLDSACGGCCDMTAQRNDGSFRKLNVFRPYFRGSILLSKSLRMVCVY